MTIVEVQSGKVIPIEILLLENDDYKSISESRYYFDWKKEKKQEVYKLVINGQTDILGLISIERIPSEWRIHIRLLTVSKENSGKGKIFENIVGNLMTHVAKLAVMEFAEMACISLKSKSAIEQHYIKKYNMSITGMTLSLEVPEILNLIKQYAHD